jgi:DNA-binding NarL/FixJ family response regulator
MSEIREATQALVNLNSNSLYLYGHAGMPVPLPIDALSKRELQVASKIMEGLPNKIIASELFISERTVKFHCANIYRKLNINSRTALIAACFKTLYSPRGD